MGDLTSRRLIVLKGVLFAFMAALSGVLVVIGEDWWWRAGTLLICVWSSCRFYYFLFYVLERYVGIAGRYAGILDLLKRLWALRSRG